jgi:hypothetical protein
MISEGWFVRCEADISEFVNAEMTGAELPIFLVKGCRQQMTQVSPFGAPGGLAFFGFDLRHDLYPELSEPPVVLFSIHAIVSGWNSFHDFVDYIISQPKWGSNDGWMVGGHGFLVRLPSATPDA